MKRSLSPLLKSGMTLASLSLGWMYPVRRDRLIKWVSGSLMSVAICFIILVGIPSGPEDSLGFNCETKFSMSFPDSSSNLKVDSHLLIYFKWAYFVVLILFSSVGPMFVKNILKPSAICFEVVVC